MKIVSSKSALVVASALMFTLSLSSCSLLPAKTATAPTNPSSATPSQTIEVLPSATPGPNLSSPVPVSVGCNDLLPAEAIYDFNPNFSATNPPKNEPGSIQESISQQGGLICSIQNQSNSEVIVFGISQIPTEDLEYVTSSIANSSRSVDDYGTKPEVTGFFSEEKGVGIAQVITSGYRIFVSSAFFQEASDAKGLIATLSKRLP